jgi:hypothetical protein
MNITAPFSNSSWNLDFYGPALSCSPAEAVRRQNITNQVLATIVPGGESESECGGGGLLSYGYLSWTPGYVDNESLPFDYSISNITESYTLWSTTLGSVNSSLTLFFMAISRMINPYNMSVCCENTICGYSCQRSTQRGGILEQYRLIGSNQERHHVFCRVREFRLLGHDRCLRQDAERINSLR